MSFVLDIQSTFDGATVVNLRADAPDLATDTFLYTPVAAGRLQLWASPMGATPLWIQRLSLSAGLVASLRLPDGLVWPVVGPWNLLAPQGSELVIDGGAGQATIYARTINSDNWHRMQCCHQYAPVACVPPEIESVDASPGTEGNNTVTITGSGFLPTDTVEFIPQGPGSATVNSVTYVDSTELSVDVDFTAGDYLVRVVRAGDGECFGEAGPIQIQAA